MSVSFPSTQRLDFEWEGGETPASINYKLMKIGRLYGDPPHELLAEAKGILRMDMRKRFEQEIDPQGRHWDELVAPEPEQIGILRRGSTQAAMFTAAMSNEAWTTSPQGVFFNAGVLPGYWVRHEQPSGTEGGDRVPRREFIAPSEEAQIEIEEYADYWLHREVEEIIYEPAPIGVFGRGGRQIGVMGQTTMLGGIARREVRDPATGRFVSTRPEFYGSY